MSKVTIFYPISPKFFVDFFGIPIFSHVLNKFPPVYYFFNFLNLITVFFLLFRPKNCFLDLKISLNRLKTLKNTVLAFKLMRKTIFFSRPTSFLQKSSGKG